MVPWLAGIGTWTNIPEYARGTNGPSQEDHVKCIAGVEWNADNRVTIGRQCYDWDNWVTAPLYNEHTNQPERARGIGVIYRAPAPSPEAET